jgi:hypothetical protein
MKWLNPKMKNFLRNHIKVVIDKLKLDYVKAKYWAKQNTK